MFVPDGQCSSGIPNGLLPPPAEWLARQRALLAGDSAAIAQASDSYESGKLRSPLDFADLGLNIMKDVWKAHRGGRIYGGPRGTGTLQGETPDNQCDTQQKGVEVVDLNETIHLPRLYPDFETSQAVTVPNPSGVTPEPKTFGISDALEATPYPVSCTPASDTVNGVGPSGWWLLLGFLGLALLTRDDRRARG